MKKFVFIMLAVALVFFLALASCGGGNEYGDIVQGNGFAEKVNWLETNAQSGGKYVIEVNADSAIFAQGFDFGNRSDITVTVRGSGSNRTLSLSSISYMFVVPAGVTLLLENITLRGRSDNDYALVYIAPGGALVMNSGSAIIDNTSKSIGGVIVYGNLTMNGGTISRNRSSGGRNYPGGVMVYGSGSFIMNGGTISSNSTDGEPSGGVGIWGTFVMNNGTISGNTSGWGGGGVDVYTYSAQNAHGTFYMYGGTISGNTARRFGGGVFVGSNSTFIMSGGTISGNTADIGGGVSVRGIFSKTGGTITGRGARDANVVLLTEDYFDEGAAPGQAVYATNPYGGHLQIGKETTAGPSVNLYFNGGTSEDTATFSGAWDWSWEL